MPHPPKWLTVPLGEMYATCFKLLQENVDVIDISMQEKDDSGYERSLKLIVVRNESQEGDDESVQIDDKDDQPQFSDL